MSKKKLFLGIASLGLLGMVGAGLAGLNAKTLEVKAEGAADWSIVGPGNKWDNDVELEALDGYAGHKTITLAKGDNFKIRKDKAWTTSYGYNNFSATNSSYMFYANGENAVCSYAGDYDIRLTTKGEIEVYYVPTVAGAGEDCYVLGKTGAYTNAHVYGATLDVYPWANSKSFDGNAKDNILSIRHTYDVWFDGGTYGGYHIYKIDAQLHKEFNVIFRNMGESKQSSTIPASTTNALYVDKGNVASDAPAAEVKLKTSDEYAVAKLVYDIGAVRGSNTYKGRTFAYTFCNATQEQAASLVDRYDALAANDGAKALLDRVKTSTYSDAEIKKEGAVDESAKAEYSLSAIIESLRTIANNKETKVFSISGTLSMNDLGTPLAIIGVASIVTVGIFFFVSKRKKESK